MPMSPRRLSVGDRLDDFGNKGVIAEEDKRNLPRTEPVDIVFKSARRAYNQSDFGETHLGWAARILGLHFATPFSGGAGEKKIKGIYRPRRTKKFDELGIPPSVIISGKTRLHDG